MESNTPYTEVSSVFEYLGITGPSESSSLFDEIENWILAMSRYIDKYCNRVIYIEGGESAAEEFKYDGDNTSLLHIKDCVGIQEVKIDGVVYPSDKWVKYPANKPYASRIALVDGYIFTKGMQNVSITAIHAMNEELPEDVKLACTILVAGIYNARYGTGKSGTTEKIGNYSVSFDTQDQVADFESVHKILNGYKRISL